MSVANKVVKNTGFLYAKMGITLFISLYTTRLILNTLGTEDFGIFNIVGGAIAMLGFLNSAMAGSTQRFMSYSEGKGNKERQKLIFNISLVLHLFIAVIIGIFLIVMGYFFFNGILNINPERIFASKVVYGSLIISTVFTMMSVPYDAVLNAHENMLYYSIAGISESFLKLGIALALINFSGDKLILYGVLTAAIPLITLTIMRIYCHKYYEECVIAPKLYWEKSLTKEMTSFAGWGFASASSSMVGNYGIGILLNHFFGTILNASFGIAAQLNGQIVSFSNTMMKALNPAIIKSEGRGERKSMLKYTLLGCKFSFFLFSFFAIPFLIETPMILNLWLKNVPSWAVVFCRLAILRTMLEQLTLPLNTAISAQGEIKSYSLVKTILFLIPLPLIFFIFSKGYPAYSMLIVTLIIGGIIDGINSLVFAINKCGLVLSEYFEEVIKKVTVVFLFSFIIGLIPISIIGDSIYRLIFVISLSMLSFLFMLFIFGFSNEEKIHLNFFLDNVQRKLLRKLNTH